MPAQRWQLFFPSTRCAATVARRQKLANAGQSSQHGSGLNNRPPQQPVTSPPTRLAPSVAANVEPNVLAMGKAKPPAAAGVPARSGASWLSSRQRKKCGRLSVFVLLPVSLAFLMAFFAAPEPTPLSSTGARGPNPYSGP